MNKSKLELYAHLTITLIGVGILAFLFLKFLFLPILPFLISWAAAFLLRPAVAFISSKSRIPKKIVSVAMTILCVCLGIGLVALFAFFAVKEAWELFSYLAADEEFIAILAKITNPLGALLGSEASGALTEQIRDAIKEGISGLVSTLVTLLSEIASSVPKVLFFILITVIASVYFALDIEKINSYVKSVLPEKVSNMLIGFKNTALSVGMKYVRSYLTIMLITFTVMLIGLLLLGVENVFILALIIAILDLLPIIGVGTVLVPWSILEFILGNTGTGIGLIVLLVIHELIRQFAEPKIVGKNLGVHPIISLLLLYVGYSVFGIIGLLLVPLLAVAINIITHKKNTAEVS